MVQGMTTLYSQHHRVFKMTTLDKLPSLVDYQINITNINNIEDMSEVITKQVRDFTNSSSFDVIIQSVVMIIASIVILIFAFASIRR